MTTPDPTPTPAQVLELAELLEKQAKKASPHLWPEQCGEIAATLRAQADALAEREAECERLRAEWQALTDTVGVPVGFESDVGQVSLAAVRRFGAIVDALPKAPAEAPK